MGRQSATTFTGAVDMGSNTLTVPTPTNSTDAATKAYADLKLAKASNLSDVASASTTRTNLGLGTAATATAPSGTIVGTTDTQTLTNKTLTSPAVTTPTGIVKGDVGLGNVDNTSDSTKNSATATLTNKTLTAPKVDGIYDTNGNLIFALSATASSTNYLQAVNGATGNAPQLKAIGSDPNVGMTIISQGTGLIAIQPGTNTTGAFRVRNAAGTSHAINVDTSNLRLGVGNVTANSPLHVGGAIATAIAAKTGAYTLVATDSLITGDATSAAFQLTLPTAVGCDGREYTLKKIDSSGNAVTVGTTSSQTIDGSTTYALATQWKYVKVKSNGANWLVVGNN